MSRNSRTGPRRPPPSHRKGRRSKSGKGVMDPRRGATDRAIYISLIIIGLAVVAMGFLITTGAYWAEIGIGYIAIVAAVMNLSAWRAYRGRRVPLVQSALARIPLRPVGFGAKGGRPLAAAEGDARASSAIVISLILSIAVVAVLVALRVMTA